MSLKKAISKPKNIGRPRIALKPASYHPNFSMSELLENPNKLMHYAEYSLIPNLVLFLQEKGAELVEKAEKDKESIENDEKLNKNEIPNHEDINHINDDNRYGSFEFFLRILGKATAESLKLSTEFKDFLINFFIKFAHSQKEDEKIKTKELINPELKLLIKNEGVCEKLKTICQKWKVVFRSIKKTKKN